MICIITFYYHCEFFFAVLSMHEAVVAQVCINSYTGFHEGFHVQHSHHCCLCHTAEMYSKVVKTIMGVVHSCCLKLLMSYVGVKASTNKYFVRHHYIMK